ncbi:unnamed protein product [Lactuca virosa]|uniref:RRM domain-containing protein n=1 Tax=Lactuca virosa TaxID=75947 RepID=A0AAU9PKV1_9ASTR|nr:unnamed protein product [Lactuca virosa]
MGDGWTEVRHRKKPGIHRNDSDITSYFVSNIPNGTTKEEFRRIFKTFGTLSDVYFGGRKGKNGKNFGFIRFENVTDKKLLESKLNGIICRNYKLEINIARHERTEKLQPPSGVRRWSRTHVPIPVKVRGGFTGEKSYAEALSGGDKVKILLKNLPPNLAPVRLVINENMVRWLKGSTLIGEVKSLDHLGHLPALLSIHCDMDMKVKYAGGMKAILEFGSSSKAKDFLSNEKNWKDIFNSIKLGGENDYKFDRVANVRIVGLPIRLWSEPNFSAIVEKFGKIIIPFDHIGDRMDLSVVKIGILTEEKKKINEVIKTEVGEETFDIGVVEYEDEPWFPFKFDDVDQPYQSEPEDNSDGDTEVVESDKDDGVHGSNEDEDGISDTWMDDIEDGEIVGDVNRKSNGIRCCGIAGEEVSSDGPDAVAVPHQAPMAILESEKAFTYSNEVKTILIPTDTGLTDDNEACGDKPKEFDRGTVGLAIQDACKMDNPLLGSPRPTSPTSFPSILAQSGCFGPFPYNKQTPSPTCQTSQLQGINIGRS